MKKILFYTNQFFGQIGGEDMAYTEPQIFEGMHGSANTFGPQLKDVAEIVATIVCGDNFYAENMDTGRAYIRQQIEKYQPDLLIAGPAFNAGRFGIACGDVCKTAKEMGVEAITGLYEENPAVEMYRKDVYILQVAKSAAGIRKAVPLMAGFAKKLLTGEPLGSPKAEQYYAKGQRVNIFREKNGAERAVDMLLAKIHGEPYETELEISTYEKVEPSAPIADLSKAKIALCTSGGVVPMGNPDHMVAATAKFWKAYELGDAERLEPGQWESVHAGYDPVYANNDPNRVAPYDMLKILEKEGVIGSVYPVLCTTTGNSTAVADATRMGQEIAERLLSAGVDGVILTST
jgi:glycine reductase